MKNGEVGQNDTIKKYAELSVNSFSLQHTDERTDALIN